MPLRDDVIDSKMAQLTGFSAATRRIVIDWMYDVCQEVTADQDVWMQAVNCLDRYVSYGHHNKM